MFAEVILYHNNRCSKSREALAFLLERDVALQVVHYLDTPPSAPDLYRLYQMLGLASVRGMMRTKDDLYKALGLADERLDDAALLCAIAEHPQLLERPIAVVGEKAAIGRPLDNIAALLDMSV